MPMAPRRGLFGLAGVIAAAGLAAGEPPVNPLVEGRESDPVAREFYQPEKPPGGSVSAPMMPEQTNPDRRDAPGAWAAMVAGVWESFLDRMTFPLGLVQLPQLRLDG
jgi:hypothetical protein